MPNHIKSIDKLLTLAAHMALEIPDHMATAATVANALERTAGDLAGALVAALKASLAEGKGLSPDTFKLLERVLPSPKPKR